MQILILEIPFLYIMTTEKAVVVSHRLETNDR